jgi:hypothetical protein
MADKTAQAAIDKINADIAALTQQVNAGKNTAASTSVAAASGGLLGGIDTTQTVLKNDFAGAYAFWTQADQSMTDANGNVMAPKYSLLDALNASIKGKYLQASDPTLFFNELKKTDWYQKYAGQGLLAADAFYNNNTQYNLNLNTRKSQILQQATSLGYKISDKVATDLATGSLYTAFDDTAWKAYQQTTLNKSIVEAASHYNVPLTGGTGVKNEQALRAYAMDMGGTYSDGWFTDAANKINDPSSGMDTAAYQKIIRDHAISQYAGFGDLLNKGMTVKQIADPYMQQMGNILELDPTAIDYSKDPLMQQALGAGGNQQPMSMWQFQQNLRKDPRWAMTNNARDTVDGIAHGILKDFGVMS